MPDTQSFVIVTGCSGFIGEAMCQTFVREGYAVVGFDRPDVLEPQPGVTNVPCDVTSEASVAEAMQRVLREFPMPLASVIHLAAYYDFSGEPSPLYEGVTIQGTERLLQHLAPLRPEQFVFSSTMLVHAPCEPGQHIDEEWTLDPKWDYPQSKARTEQVIRARHASMPIVLLRIAGVYTDRCESLPLAHQMQRIYERRLTSKVFPGDVTRGQSFVHLEDVVDAFRATVAQRASLPREAVMLIGEADPPSYDELQRAFARHIHGELDWDTLQIPKAIAKTGAWVQDQIPGIEDPFIKPWMIDLADDHYALDVSRARQLLGWSPRHELRETVPKMVNALKGDPAGFYRANKLQGAPPRAAASAAARTAASRGGM